MRPNIRKKDGENITDATIAAVISKLESDTPITKVAACAELSISYNPARLTKIIEEYTERKEFISKRKKELRNTPVSSDDASYIVSAYFEGQPLQDMADNIFRSIGVVKGILKKYNIPMRRAGMSYYEPVDLECETIPDSYNVGDMVYSARYDSAAEIMKVITKDTYRIWLFNDCKYAYQPSYELADLRKVQNDLGIKIEFMSDAECKQEIMTARRNANKKVKE